MEETLKQEMTQDLQEIKLRDDYERDLVIIRRCINELHNVKYDRTTKYEQDLLKLRKSNGH